MNVRLIQVIIDGRLLGFGLFNFYRCVKTEEKENKEKLMKTTRTKKNKNYCEEMEQNYFIIYVFLETFSG